MLAAMNGHAATTDKLITHHADVNAGTIVRCRDAMFRGCALVGNWVVVICRMDKRR